MNKEPTTKERIERAAIELIAERGVDAVSMRDIARRVDVTEPAVYRHYASKSALVWEVFTSNYDVFAANLDTIQRSKPSFREKLEAMVTECCGVFDNDCDLFTFLLLAQHIQRGAPKDFQAALPELLKNLLSSAIAIGEIPDQDCEITTAMIMGSVLQTALYCLYQKPHPKKMCLMSETLSSACWRIAKGI
jgi:AcrR family transcriptional regulator